MNLAPPAGHLVARNAFELPARRYTPTRDATAAARRVLVFVDPSPDAANAAWRGALIARDGGLHLHLVALQPLHADIGQAASQAGALAADVRAQLPLRVSSEGIVGTLEHEGLKAARDASLIVLAASTAMGRWMSGSALLQLLRGAGRPVLAVRMPASAGYQHVVAAVELDRHARSVVSAAHGLSRGARLQVLHVLDIAHEEVMRLADVSEFVIRSQRQRDADRTRSALADVIASAGAQQDGVDPVVAFGHPRQEIVRQLLARDAELLVIGKRPRAALAEAMRRGVLQRVLRNARADVLVLPVPAPR